MSAQFIAAAQHWLSGNAVLPDENAEAISRVTAELADTLAERPALVIGVSGPPGTGKSTFAGACMAGLEATGKTCLGLSLDDYYLPLSERQALAASRHPLMQRRGTPGTHDIGLLARHLALLTGEQHGSLELPLFDKSCDDRSIETRTIAPGTRPTVLFIEGWLVGAPPEAASVLEAPVNELEALQDADGAWRRWTNRKLDDYHQALTPFLDLRWHLDAPDWSCVVEWRWQQERERTNPWLNGPAEVRDFLATYQRICMHMHRSCAQWSDAVVTLDRHHRPMIRRIE